MCSSGLCEHFNINTFTHVLTKASNSSQQAQETLAGQRPHNRVLEEVRASHMKSCKYVLVSAEGSGRYAKVKAAFVFSADPCGRPSLGAGLPVQAQ